jgi:hypothetical protein
VGPARQVPPVVLAEDPQPEHARPAKDGNLLVQLPFSEARWTWMRVEVPLAGDSRWERRQKGDVSLNKVAGLGIALDSWGGDPFTVWLDGLSFE